MVLGFPQSPSAVHVGTKALDFKYKDNVLTIKKPFAALDVEFLVEIQL